MDSNDWLELKGCTIVVVTGNQAGRKFKIKSFNEETHTLTVEIPWYQHCFDALGRIVKWVKSLR